MASAQSSCKEPRRVETVSGVADTAEQAFALGPGPIPVAAVAEDDEVGLVRRVKREAPLTLARAKAATRRRGWLRSPLSLCVQQVLGDTLRLHFLLIIMATVDRSFQPPGLTWNQRFFILGYFQ